jgi:hypothetical protein
LRAGARPGRFGSTPGTARPSGRSIWASGSGGEITFRGTAEILGGTGGFRGIEAHGLRAFDHNTLDGQSGTFTLDGQARY